MDLSTLTIKKAHESLKKGEYSVWDLAQAYLKVIEEKDKEINAYLEVFSDVKEQAEAAQKRFADGTADLLTGIPFSIKDNILIEGRRVGAASKVLEGYIASYDATVISKLKEKGVVFLGRGNMDEFAMGASTETSAYGVTRNPHDTSRVPGGSSGGPAAAVAMNGALVALGSDTGGSIRQPASFCGIVGLKPTYGRTSRHGLIAMASSLDHIGPFSKTVEDAKIVFEAIAGKDRFDSTSQDAPSGLSVEPGPKKVGVPFSFLKQGGIDQSVVDNLNQSIEKFKKAGYEIVDIELPNINYSVPVYYVVVPAEVSSNMARFDGVKYGALHSGKDLLEDYMLTRGNLIGKEVRRRIILGTYVLSAGYYDAYYNKANIVRQLITEDFKKAFERVDVIIMPTSPHAAFKIGEKISDPLTMYLEDIFTAPADLVGVPAISVPSGSVEVEGSSTELGVKKKLPLGLQIIAPHFREDVLLEVAAAFESLN
jgi:aspartyl-tRNA(Asn)/glutamyl-tRNA(Gln) amidotransferase subunit A